MIDSWEEYRKELEGKQALIDELRSLSKRGTLTLLYSAKDVLHNQAAVLKEFLEAA